MFVGAATAKEALENGHHHREGCVPLTTSQRRLIVRNADNWVANRVIAISSIGQDAQVDRGLLHRLDQVAPTHICAQARVVDDVDEMGDILSRIFKIII